MLYQWKGYHPWATKGQSLPTELGPHMPHCRNSLGPKCRRGASRTRKRKMEGGKESNKFVRISPSIVFAGFPHINGSLELVLKSDNVPNDRIWFEIK